MVEVDVSVSVGRSFAESGVEVAVSGKADQAVIDQGVIVIAAGDAAVASHDDLAIRLDGDALGDVLSVTADVHHTCAIDAETGVQVAVGVVAQDGEIPVIAAIAETRHQDLAVGLQGDAIAAIE